MTNRISRLKTALFANTREISLERALLYTASHRQTEGEPVILRRAKATAYILEHVEISIIKMLSGAVNYGNYQVN